MQAGFEPWFGFPFQSAPLPTSLTAPWAACAPAAAAAAPPAEALQPPPPSSYHTTLRYDVPACFDSSGAFVPRPPAAPAAGGRSGGLHFPSEVARRRVPPQRLLDTPQMRLWHLPAVYHSTPRAQVCADTCRTYTLLYTVLNRKDRRISQRYMRSRSNLCLNHFCISHPEETHVLMYLAAYLENPA